MKLLARCWRRLGFLIFFFILIGGLMDSRIALISLLCIITPIILSATGKKRLWCKTMCPRGNYYDNVVSQFSRQKPTPKIFKSFVFKGIVLVLAVFVFGIGLKRNLATSASIGVAVYRFTIITTIAGTTFSYIFHHRTWCIFCPIGTLSRIISFFRK